MCERPALPSRSPAVRKLVFPKSEGSALACLGGRSIVAKLRNSGRFARAAAQIVKFRPAHHATANDIDALDVRRVEREHTLHTLAEGNLAHGEAGTETLVRTRDAHAFVVLDTGAFAFHDPHADAQRVAGAELGNLLRLVELGYLLGFKRLADVHLLPPLPLPARSRAAGTAPPPWPPNRKPSSR